MYNSCRARFNLLDGDISYQTFDQLGAFSALAKLTVIFWSTIRNPHGKSAKAEIFRK